MNILIKKGGRLKMGNMNNAYDCMRERDKKLSKAFIVFNEKSHRQAPPPSSHKKVVINFYF